MKVWKSILIDDEPLAILELKRLLKDHYEIAIIGEATSFETGKLIIEELKPDLIFLDIDLGTHSGFDLLESLKPDFQTIFITAFNDFAIRAFEVNALDYLLKPVHPERLKESLKRLGNPYKDENKLLLKPFDKILLNQHSSTKFITVSEISYIEALGDYTKICTENNICGICHHTIKKWITRLPDIFCQTHRSFIVNLNNVKHLNKIQSNRYEVEFKKLSNKIPVSKMYSKAIRDKFMIR